MTYAAIVVEVMLASPGDVQDERATARKVIDQWNAENARQRKVALQASGWETHIESDIAGKRPQVQINKRLVDQADLMVGIFWTRLGSPTGRSPSGTVEEIKRHYKAKKPLMLFFSDAPVTLKGIDSKQYEKLAEFRDWARNQGIIGVFKEKAAFEALFRQHLGSMMRSNDRMQSLIEGRPVNDPISDIALSNDAVSLLRAFGANADGPISVLMKADGILFTSRGTTVLQSSDALGVLKWRSALDELLKAGVLSDRTGRNQVFELAPKAAKTLSSLPKSKPIP